MRRCVWSRNIKNKEAMAHVGPQHQKEEKKLAPSSILREAKIAYYARNMFEAGRFLFFFS